MITGNFDLTHVNQMLSEHQRPLSKNAQNFKTLFENFQINPPGGSTNNDVGNITRTANLQPPKMADLLTNPLLLNNLTNSFPVMTKQTVLKPKQSDSSEPEKPLENCESELPTCIPTFLEERRVEKLAPRRITLWTSSVRVCLLHIWNRVHYLNILCKQNC